MVKSHALDRPGGEAPCAAVDGVGVRGEAYDGAHADFAMERTEFGGQVVRRDRIERGEVPRVPVRWVCALLGMQSFS